MHDLWTKDGKWITNYLAKACSSYSLVAEIGSNANYHWHFQCKVRDPVKFGMFIDKWRRKKGHVHSSRDDVQKVRNVPWISESMESKLAVHVYMRKFCNELPQYLGISLRKHPVTVRILTKSTRPIQLSYIKAIRPEEIKKTKEKLERLRKKTVLQQLGVA